MYQSGRAGDKAKKRKSPAKSGRVGITAKWRAVKPTFFAVPAQQQQCCWSNLLHLMEYYMEKTLKSKRQVFYFECY